MAKYLISFPSAAMVVPDDEFEAVGRDAHAVIDGRKPPVFTSSPAASTKAYRPYASPPTARLQWAAILGRQRSRRLHRAGTAFAR